VDSWTKNLVFGSHCTNPARAGDCGARYTARKLAEEASILEERNRMAREIHDTLAQAFTGILIQVGGGNLLTDDSETLRI